MILEFAVFAEGPITPQQVKPWSNIFLDVSPRAPPGSGRLEITALRQVCRDISVALDHSGAFYRVSYWPGASGEKEVPSQQSPGRHFFTTLG